MALFGDKNVKHIHCVGVGGIGVSALAEILLKHGYKVSGSDVANSSRLEYLKNIGVNVYVGHNAENVIGADLVVYSSAVNDENPELVYAKEHGILQLQRGQLLADIMELYLGVAVTGTHGKTTTTAILAHICVEAGIDPTYFIGGIPSGKSSPVHLGAEDGVFIAEADESDASFLYMQPKISIVTNIECDHMETYSDSEDTLRQSFLQFLEHVSADGVSILCSDDANIQSISSQLTCKKIFYGVNDSADYLIHDYNQNGLSSSAILSFNSNITRLKLNLPGLYNIKNAVAAAIAANCIGIGWDTITKALSSFKGVGRRFQLLGDVKAGMKQLTIFEDYGHHPTEVKVAYEAAVNAFTDKKVILVFQPHRYTRTRDLMSEFVDVLSCVSSLVLLPTYSASEDAIAGATSEDLFNELKRNGKSSVVYADNSESLMYILEELSNNGDVVIFQGAGDVSYVAKRLVSKCGIKNEK